MGRKGVSYEEKRTRMLDYFYEHQQVFALKELEKQLPKVKGIVSQSVKDVLQSLVDDNLVDFDKIGSGNFFWALPSKASLKRKTIENGLEESLSSAKQRKETLQQTLSEAQEGREVSSERTESLQRLSEQRKQLQELIERIAYFKSHGSHKLTVLEDKTNTCKEACTRWTDNVFNMLSFFKKQRPDMKESLLLQHFGLSADFDYLE